MFCRSIIVLLILGFSNFTALSQKNDTQKTSKPTAEQKERDAQIRSQAVFLLKDNLSKYRSIKDFRQKSGVVIEAATVLWDYDRTLAEESLVGFIHQCLADYKNLLEKEKRTNDEENDFEDIGDALREALKAITRRDPKGASLLQSKYFKIKEDALKAKNLSEEMQLAAEGLDVDEKRTVNLLLAIIQQGVPGEFPKLYNDLKARKPEIAEILLQRAMQNLAVNPAYKVTDAIYLSVAIFNEGQREIPLIPDASVPNNFGLFTMPGEKYEAMPSKESMSSYFAAVQAFFSSRLVERSVGVVDSNQNLIRSHFLLEKLKAYGTALRMLDPETLDRFSIPVTATMRTAGFTDQTLMEVRDAAYRLATTNNPFDLDDGTRSFDKAENAKTPEEKMKHLVDGIIAAIEYRQFGKAEGKIFDVQDPEIKDALYLFLNMRASLYAIENKDWREFEKRTEKLVDRKIKAFLYVKAISTFESGKVSHAQLTEYVFKAEKNINDISDKTAKASAQVTLASFLLSLEKTETIRDVPSAIFSVNEAPNYDEYPFSISVTVPDRRRGNFGEYIGENSFKDLFSRLARNDWADSQVQVLQIKRNGLLAIAQIAAAKTVLQGKGLAK